MSSDFKRQKINGGIDAVIKRAKSPGTVDVGIIDAGKHEDSEETVAQVGFDNEYGTEVVPERSFMRSTTKEKKKEIIAFQKKIAKKIVKGEISMEHGLGLLGEFMTDLIKRKIVAIKSPPNSFLTIKEKGSSNPLIDTGQMLNSVTYEVNR